MYELITWLTAQLDYDQADLVNARVHRELPAEWIDRLERDVDAKRTIVDDAAAYLRDGSSEVTDGLAGRVLTYLAQPYADRPGYRPEWTPDGS